MKIRDDISYERYAAADGIRCSDFCGPTPAHWQAGAEGKRDTAALRFGRLLHLYVIEGRNDYAVKPDGMSFATTEGKQWKVAHSDREILNQKEHEAILGIEKSIRAVEHNGKDYLAEALLFGRRELSCFAECPDTGLLRKCRLDLLPRAGQFKDGDPIIDFKSCVSAAPDVFDREILKRGYYLQAAWYLSIANACGLSRSRFYLVACEKQPPYAVRVVDLNDDWINAGTLRMRKFLRQWKTCIQSGEWPGYSSEPEISCPPAWLTTRDSNAPTSHYSSLFADPTPNQPYEMESDCLV